MLDTPATYPLLRGRRPRERKRTRWRRGLADRVSVRALRLTLIAFVSLGLVAAIVVIARSAAAPKPETELAASLVSLKQGNYSAARNHAQSATAARPDWALAHAVLARAYLALGDGGYAEGELQRALGGGFDPKRAHQMLAHAYWLEGDTDRAIAEADRAALRYAGYAARIRARALADQGDYAAAQARLQTVLARHPGDSAAWSDLGRVRYQAGDLAGAGEAAGRATALDPANLDGMTLAGEVIRSRYGLVAALPWFEAALKRDAYFHPALIEYAATLGDLGRYEKMLDATRRALAARPGSPQALYLQAVLAARAGNYDLSRSMLAKTNGAVDSMPGALLLGGALDYIADKPQQAIGRWRELLGRQPFNLAARRLLGAAQLRAGRTGDAIQTLRPLARRADADSYTLRLIARAAEMSGDRTAAARYLDRAAQAGGASTPYGSDDALPVLAAAMAEEPANPSAAVEYVRGLIAAGDTDTALARARAIASASPGAPGAHLLLGDTLMTTGRAGEAMVAYRRAASLDFGTPALLRLIDAAARTGRPRAGAEALALYLAQNPQNLIARRLAANLQLQARDWDAAIDTLEDIRTATGNRDAVLLAQLSQAYAGADDAQTARRYGRAAYALAPMNAGVADAYGWALYQAGDVPAALQLVTKAARIAPASSAIRWHFAQLLAETKRNAEAQAAITAALSDPAFADRDAASALLRTL